MPFQIDDVWRRITDGVEPRRAAVAHASDDGSEAALLFDDGTIQSVTWAEFERAGTWEPDQSPRPAIVSEELRQRFLRAIQSEPECPRGTDAQIEAAVDGDWGVAVITAPGEPNTNSGCEFKARRIARALRRLFALQGVPFRGLPTPPAWMSSPDGGSLDFARVNAQRSFAAASFSNLSQPPFPLRAGAVESAHATAHASGEAGDSVSSTLSETTEAVSAESASTGAEAGNMADGSARKVGPDLLSASVLRARLAVRLSENTTDVLFATRNLSAALKVQIELANDHRPNDELRLAQHNQGLDALRGIAELVDELADALDRAIQSGRVKSPEPKQLGKALDTVRRLARATMDAAQVLAPQIGQWTTMCSVFVALFKFLTAFGVDPTYATFVVAAIMGLEPAVKGVKSAMTDILSKLSKGDER